MNSNLVIVCVHVLNGQQVYHQTEGYILCEKCFKHYNSYGHDENGYWKIPKGIKKSDIVETFCIYVEDDYYEWLKENYKSFFHSLSQNKTEWNWIRGRIKHYLKK